MPTIIEPLREQWQTVYATALTTARSGNLAEAQRLIREFHGQLCETYVLDPACGRPKKSIMNRSSGSAGGLQIANCEVQIAKCKVTDGPTTD